MKVIVIYKHIEIYSDGPFCNEKVDMILTWLWLSSWLWTGYGPDFELAMILTQLWLCSWLNSVCGPDSTLSMVLTQLWLCSWLNCGYGPDSTVAMVLTQLWLWSWFNCDYGPDLTVAIVLIQLWLWSWLICGYSSDSTVAMVLIQLWLWSWLNCGLVVNWGLNSTCSSVATKSSDLTNSRQSRPQIHYFCQIWQGPSPCSKFNISDEQTIISVKLVLGAGSMAGD